MRAAGIVVEHNPFHNGHLHHIKETREITGCDVVIAVMSGNFLQRGEPALVNKWSRTEMALNGGADIVIELPYVFATAQASEFARGAITLLDSLKCESFCFGSEEGNTATFLETLHILDLHKGEYNAEIHRHMQDGVSYPNALNKAFHFIQQKTEKKLVDLSKPNNILGYHYMEAAVARNSSMKPLTIQRIIAGYHDDIEEGVNIASATGIRKALFDPDSTADIHDYVPDSTAKLLQGWEQEWGLFANWELFWPYLRYSILRLSKDELKTFAEVTEGMEHAIARAAKETTAFHDFMERIKSKRFTWTRIQRMLTHILTGFTWDDLHQLTTPSYIRLLGMNSTGQDYLNAIKSDVPLPVISKVGKTTDPMLLLDCQTTDIYMSLLTNGSHPQALQLDWKTPPIIL
ncbi:nucleotidyltransferase [Paenisporosarcina cavernae]|uniref:tRNA(Met) cytidine acetate ligase n=1 Tax=Paenisporosarcina cavernae TaxID=2320858 RepID=A0A385YQU9_9BACL|nr:nucleotidyltransferase [Paenisporosarcina cavernae]AYC29145.1 nucleotidyltransferase [Paenisporosarcina cavernae]